MFEKVKSFVAQRKIELITLFASGSVLASYVDFSNLSDTLTEIGTVLFPGLINLIVGAVPALIIIAVVGFIITFLDRILAMIERVL
jgi:hypothetical protein